MRLHASSVTERMERGKNTSEPAVPRRPHRAKRSTPHALVQTLRARFEPDGKTTGRESGGVVCDQRTSVLERVQQFDALNDRMLRPAAPLKPPRTFVHDIYTKMKWRAWRSTADDSVVARDYDEVCMRRSRSDEHIYAEPGASRSSAEPRELHYMSSPISNVVQDGALPLGVQRGVTSQISDAIRQSFTMAWQQLSQKQKPDDGDTQKDTSSEVSIKDVQKRLIYVRSIRRGYTYNASCEGCQDGTEKLFDFVLLIGYRCVNPSMSPQPDVLYSFPKETSCPGYDPVVIAHLCMPEDFSSQHATSHKRCVFFFTLVRENGEKTFFHCLQTSQVLQSRMMQSPVVLCLASRASAPAFYHKLLMDMEAPLQQLLEPGWTQLLSSLAEKSLPLPGCYLLLGHGDIATTRPLDDKFEWAQLTPLLAVLEPPVLLRIVSSLILERRIILVSEDSRLVRSWLESVECLTYPFRWPHVRVGLLPKSLLALCSSAEPYLLGVHATMAHTALELLSGPVLVVDVDHGTLLCEDEDNVDVIPNKLRNSLCTALSLAKNMTDPTGCVRDMMITEAFVRLFVELVGHCDQHIIMSDDLKESTFQRDAFMRAPSSRGAQMFLQWFVETEAFQQFLRERTQRLRQLARTPHHHLLPKGLFERRAGEYLLDLEQTNRCLGDLGRKVKTIGEKFRNLKAFYRE
ncbi:DENN domain-containing protein 2D isoform X3 [Rhipicephalus microplus]|uniref:DENN domain-containing protein 2D isoform X3 n=1 Tax=Rhipicephalus microplus TaxID=6941 RepID=UPI0018876929|nr:DENN domain-containing protein 2D-like isoform X2 [Rhipicephalus microplus]